MGMDRYTVILTYGTKELHKFLKWVQSSQKGLDRGYGSEVWIRGMDRPCVVGFLIGTLHFELQPYVHHVHPEITAISSYFDVNYWGTGVVAKEFPLEQPLLVDSMAPIQVNQGPAWRQSRDVASIAMSTPFNWLVVSTLPLWKIWESNGSIIPNI